MSSDMIEDFFQISDAPHILYVPIFEKSVLKRQ